MDLRTFDFTGHFENQAASTSEELQIAVPENELETDLLAWAILPHPQMMEEDPARRGYVFNYQLGKQLDRGVYSLIVSGTDASGVDHAVEIAAVLAIIPPAQSERIRTFSPFWLLSESVHFTPVKKISHEEYHGSAYGHLRFDDSAVLPHRRLFGATV